MRKKDILGKLAKNPEMIFTHSIKKLNNDEYSAFIHFLTNSKAMFVESMGKQVQWAGAEYKILTYLSIKEKWSLSTYYAPDNEILFWYFDISKKNFVDEQGMPCIDDIYLDLAVLPNGQIITLDADELKEALDNGTVSKKDFNNAYITHDLIINSKLVEVKFLKELSSKMRLNYE
ncbi:MAG: DUF402 domain-containing protein [Erysipelotrichales bacterium]|nr:DUF402 domain-containing protein [Erysipelotrichales bacterium]